MLTAFSLFYYSFGWILLTAIGCVAAWISRKWLTIYLIFAGGIVALAFFGKYYR